MYSAINTYYWHVYRHVFISTNMSSQFLENTLRMEIGVLQVKSPELKGR